MTLKAATCPTCWEDLVTVTCSKCSRRDESHGYVAVVSQWLRRKGWTTQPGAKTSDPLQWVCPMCSTT